MTGEIKFFRKRFIGGFNRQDVVDYIAILAKERDANLALKEKAQKDAQKLVDEIALLRYERDEARRLVDEYKSEVLDAARRTLSEFEASFEAICTGFEEESVNICEQLEAAQSIIALFPSAIKEAGSRFSGLRKLLDEGNDTPEYMLGL